MMNTYGELKTGVANWLNREDLTDEIPDFIRLAEGEIYRDLECEDNEFIATYNDTEWWIDGHYTAAIAVTDGVFAALPQNFKRMTLVTWDGSPLGHVSNQQLQQRLYTDYDSTPCAFAITGRKIAFSSAMDSNPANWETDDALIFTYYGTESLDSFPTWQVATNPVEDAPVEDTAPEDLTQTDSNTTRMFQRNPDVYLHGALYFAHLYLKDDGGASKWGTLFNNALSELKRESKRNRYSGSTSQVASAY